MKTGTNTLYKTSAGLWHSPLLDAETWLEHAFGTAVAQPDGQCHELKQVHSALVVAFDEWRQGLEADGLVTSQPGVHIAVKSADCLPLLLADTKNHVVAAVHAGWRGCAAGIAIRAVEKMRQKFGSRPCDLVAACGPSIRACCFEVGPEVARQFALWFPERDDLDRQTHINLPEASNRQLLEAGLLPERIAGGAPCTVCGSGLADPREFHSWRRDHRTGARMHSAIWIKAL